MSNFIILAFGDAKVVQIDDANARLATLRKTLEARGLITPGDAFLSKGLTAILSEAESQQTVSDACHKDGELHFLTVRRKPKDIAILVSKGNNKANLKVDVSQTLAAFKTALVTRGLMAASDVFFRKNGAPILGEDSFTVEDALDEGVLTIDAPPPPPTNAVAVPSPPPSTNAVAVPSPPSATKAIVVAKGACKAYDVDDSQTLDAFRATLEKDKLMIASDSFQNKEGGAILKALEPGSKIRDAIVDKNILKIASAERWR